ncbi:hypothetical protein ACHAP5_009476 [Fusarium lateritium]
MSSLSAKVKELLGGGDSSKEESSTHHAPGAFPTEDMEPSETREGYSKGHEHNKLHKANDPRGFTEGDSNAPQGHAYKDSGVGLTESRDPTSTSYKPTQEPISERQNEPLGTSQRSNEPLGASQRQTEPLGTSLRSNEPLGTSQSSQHEPLDMSQRHNDPLDRTTESTTGGLGPSSSGLGTSNSGLGSSTAGLGAGAGAGAGAAGLGAGNNLASRESTNLPSQGINPSSQEHTTGTGAPSTQEHPYWGDLPSGAGTGGGVHNTVIGHGSPEDEAQRHQAVHSGATQPTRTSGTLESGTFLHRNDRDESSTNTNPAGSQTHNPNDQTSGSRFTEGVAGTGAAGGAALGAHELSKRHHEETPREQTTDRTQQEKHEGRSFPLLGKDHKDTHKDSHHKEDKHDKHADEPKKESKLGALFHRNKDDKEPTEQEHDKDKHHSKAAPLAAAGAGGAYAATRGHDDNTHRDTTTHPSATQGTTQYPASGLDSNRDYTQSSLPTQQPHSQDDSHRGAGLATGAAAGLGAGALASHHRSGDDRAGHQPASGYDSQSYDPTQRSTHNPTLQSSQGTQGHGLGSGTASGLGAGALGSHSAQPSGLESSHTQGSQPANFSHRDPTGQSLQQEDSHRGAGLGAGTAAGLGAGALASHSGRDHQSGTSGLESNRGLDSSRGLDSNRGLDSQTGYPSSTTQNPIQSHDQHDSHRGTGLATGAAAGLGAGALASHSSRDHPSGTSGLDSNRGLESQTGYPSGTTQDPTHSHGHHDSSRGITAATVAGIGSGHHGSDQHSGLDSNRGLESQGTHHSSRDPTSQSYQPEDSHRGTGLATGAAAGLGAGALASHAGRDHHSGEHTGLESNRGLQSQGLPSTERSTGDFTSHSSRDPTSHSHQEGSHGGSGLVGGTAAGLGAGALASHEANKHHGSDQYGAGDNSRGLQSGLTGDNSGGLQSGLGATGDNSRGVQSGLIGTGSGLGNNSSSRNEPLTGSHSQSHQTGDGHHSLTDDANHGKYNTLASGTPSGVGATGDNSRSGLTGTGSGLGNNSSSRNEPLTGSHSQSHQSGEGHHTLTDNANHGKYNTLASGTPSGVAYDDFEASRAPVDTTQSKDSHFGSKAAGLGAAAAGAGTAGVLSHNRDQKPTEDLTRQNDPQTERGLDRQTESHRPITGAVAPGQGSSSSKPVIHKCKNCGEDNDISEYFKSKLPGSN